MAKNTLYIIALSLISIILTSTPNLALAAPAMYIDTETCEIDLPDGGTVEAPGKIVVTNSRNGNFLIVCHTQIINTSGKAFATNSIEAGLTCGAWVNTQIGPVSTDDWKLTVSASGQAILSCHFKN